ncbi:MFS transporter [Cohnella sp. CFH 77786]|uniref:MFS transporter n=1 Tax=Cohnella sp. CFH 77786 TaxID=2662265 RepID=UPI001C60E161|nr:MFS transporter [Cohnella sp. CFH 77786]MBW5447262.1 MFS transporter [Cohnella sp. CFH 77786]
MKTAVWLYLFLFVAFFDLHAQYPMLTPFAVSLGAAPSFIGLVMGMYSLTHLPGNLLAGYGVDRFGSRLFISASLTGAGLLLLLQARVTDPWHLLYIRSVSGFVLAFLSPACMSLLARLARDHVHQGKLMAGNGLVHTVASVVSPAAGAWLAATIGFNASFTVLGWILLFTGITSIMFIREPAKLPMNSGGVPGELARDSDAKGREPSVSPALEAESRGKFPWIVFILPVALSCAQGILSFELPMRAHSSSEVMTTGLLFSVVSLGALATLALLFLNRYLPYPRTLAGMALLACSYYALAAGWPLPLIAVLFVIGMAKGILFPAMTSFLLQLSGASRYGRTFSFLSISLSIGSFIGPVAAGAIRDRISPFFLSFLALMIAMVLLYPRRPFHEGWQGRTAAPPA